ncbi:MAG: hypothetical protein HZA24_03910 [Nitrospirae bacterium]|nr:hypothetical protein [Nitrospirota bacterium]
MTPSPPPHLIVNPAAGPARRRAAARCLARAAADLLPGVRIHLTRAPGHAAELAAAAAEEGAPRVFAAGGDGTFNEVLQGLAGSATALCPVPLGTASVLARELRLPIDPVAALTALIARTDHPATIGLAEGSHFRRHFLLMAGIGIDSAVIQDLLPAMKARLGLGAYFLQGLATAARYRYPTVRVCADGQEWSGTSCIVANGVNYAAGVSLAPDAGLTRPDLCMMLFSGDGPFPYLRYIGGLLAGGRHTRMEGVRVHCGPRFTVSAQVPMRGHLDGELTGPLPLTLTAVPGGIRLPLPGTGRGGARLTPEVP